MPPKGFNLETLLHGHVRYELDMLYGTALLLRSPQTDEVLSNALIESFCLHARALLDFLNNKQGLRASEFTDGTYRPLSPTQLGIPAAVTKKLDTQIAHLTKQRVSADSQKIGIRDRAQLQDGLTRALRHFESHLNSPYRGRWQTYQLPLLLFTAPKEPSATNEFVAASTTRPQNLAKPASFSAANSVTVSGAIVSPMEDSDRLPFKRGDA